MGDEDARTAREQRDDDDPLAEVESAEGGGGVRGRPFAPGNPYRFQPGRSGNPAGRPKGIGDLIDRVLAEEIDTKGELGKRDALELLVRATVRTALKGGSAGTAAFRELMDRRFGRVPLSVRLGPDEDEGPREIRIRVVTREDLPALPSARGNGNGNGNGNGAP
jgi:hypothetical protein